MKRLLASALVAVPGRHRGLASAQTYPSALHADRAEHGSTRYDYARVMRVDPVFDSGYGSSYPTSSSQRCYERQTYVRGDGYNDGYDDGYYRHARDGDDGYSDPYGNYGRGTQDRRARWRP